MSVSEEIKQAFLNSLVARAAYADITSNFETYARIQSPDYQSQMTVSMADYFVSHFMYFDHSISSGSGYGGIVFRALNEYGQPTDHFVLGNRGTQFFNSGDPNTFLATAMDIIQDGILALTGVNGQLHEMGVLFSRIPQDSVIDVAGHSLGGFLTLWTDLFFNDRVQNSFTYNGAGIQYGELWLSAINQARASLDLAPVTLNNAYNYYSVEYPEVTASLGSHFTERQPVYIDNEGSAETTIGHGIISLSNSLLVAHVLSSIDGSLDLQNINRIVEAATGGEPLDRNRVVAYLGELFGYNVASFKNSENELALQDVAFRILSRSEEVADGSDFDAKIFEFASSASYEIAAIAGSDSGNGAFMRHALKNLSSFALQNLSGTSPTSDGSIAPIQAVIDSDALELYDEATGEGKITDAWIQDRSKMAAWLTRARTGSIEAGAFEVSSGAPGSTAWQFEDVASGEKVRVVPSGSGLSGAGMPRHYVIFGSDADNTGTEMEGAAEADFIYGGGGDDHIKGNNGDDYLEGNDGEDILEGGIGNDTLQGLADNDDLQGGDGADKLFGGNGGDTLIGGAGSDLLYGGIGNDTYKIAVGDGRDRIIDSDGQGHIVVTGINGSTAEVPLQSGLYLRPNTWISADKNFHYVLGTEADGSQTLRVYPITNRSGDSATFLTIEKFVSGNLGIFLQDPPSSGPAPDTIYGDVAPEVFQEVLPDETTYESYRRDGNGNLIGTAQTLARPDVLFGNANDNTIFGLSDNDSLHGKDGDDSIYGGEGHDFISGGLGADDIFGGNGNDIIKADENLGSQAPFVITRMQPDPDGSYLYSGIDWVMYQHTIPEDASFSLDTVTPILLELNRDRFATTYDIVYSMAATSYGQTEGAVDFVDGGAGDDKIEGGAGGDFLAGGADKDEIWGESGGDLISGDAGDDLLLGDGITYSQYAWATNDTWGDYRWTFDVVEQYEDEYGDDFLYGGEGSDYIFGMAGSDILYGEGGNDYLFGDFYESVVIPYSNSSDENGDPIWVSDDAQLAQAVLHHGNDFIDGGDGDDTLVGLAGDDELYGGAGQDILAGDGAAQNVQGNFGNDYLDGGADDDTLVGGGKDDTLIGGSGNDELWGDEVVEDRPVEELMDQALHGKDSLDGGEGNDQLVGGGFDDILLGGDGHDLLFGDGEGVVNEGNDQLTGGLGDDGLVGGGGDDVLDAGDGRDALWGDAGNDKLDGGEGDDTLAGGAGNDTLIGGVGMDFQAGGEGDDTYELRLGDSQVVANGAEVIEDNAGNNKIRFAGVDLASLTLSASGTGQDLVLRYSETDAVYIVNGMQGAISSFAFGSGVTMTLADLFADLLDTSITRQTGTEGGDLFGGGADDTFTLTSNSSVSGAAGDDRITMTGNHNTVYFDLGDGSDRVTSSAAAPAAGQENRIVFGGEIASSDLSFSVQANKLVIKVGDEDAISVTLNRSDALTSPVFSIFEFADGTILDYSHWVSVDGNSATISNDDGFGNTSTEVYTGAGAVISREWSLSDGGHGSDSYQNPDGSITGEVFHADGTYSAYVSQYGRIDTTYYAAYPPVLKTKVEWSDAYSSGVDTFGADGSLTSSYTSSFGNDTTKTYANGSLVREDWAYSDGSHGYITHNLEDGSSYSVEHDAEGTYYYVDAEDALGNLISTTFTTAGVKVYEYWEVAADGTWGESEFSETGSVIYSYVQGVDSATETVTDQWQTTWTHVYDTATMDRLTSSWSDVEGVTGTKLYTYDSEGELVGSTWTSSDGFSGSETRGADGSLSGSFSHADGRHGEMTADAYGNSSSVTYDINGVKVASSVVSQDDGTRVDHVYNADGSMATTSFASDGSFKKIVDDGQGGSTTSYYDELGNLSRTSSTATVETAEGYTTTAIDSLGNTVIKRFDANGVLLEDHYISSEGAEIRNTYDVEGGYTTFIRDEEGNTRTNAYAVDGVQLNSSWTKVEDQTYGTEVYGSGGTVTRTSYNQDGSLNSITYDTNYGAYSRTEYYSDGTIESSVAVGSWDQVIDSRLHDTWWPFNGQGPLQVISNYDDNGQITQQFAVGTQYGFVYNISYEGEDGVRLQVTDVEDANHYARYIYTYNQATDETQEAWTNIWEGQLSVRALELQDYDADGSYQSYYEREESNFLEKTGYARNSTGSATVDSWTGPSSQSSQLRAINSAGNVVQISGATDAAGQVYGVVGGGYAPISSGSYSFGAGSGMATGATTGHYWLDEQGHLLYSVPASDDAAPEELAFYTVGASSAGVLQAAFPGASDFSASRYPSVTQYHVSTTGSGNLSGLVAEATQVVNSYGGLPSGGVLLGAGTYREANPVVSSSGSDQVTVSDDWGNKVDFATSAWNNPVAASWSTLWGLSGSYGEKFNEYGQRVGGVNLKSQEADGGYSIYKSNMLGYYSEDGVLTSAIWELTGYEDSSYLIPGLPEGGAGRTGTYTADLGFSNMLSQHDSSYSDTHRENPDGSYVDIYNYGGNIDAYHFDAEGFISYQRWKYADGSYGSKTYDEYGELSVTSSTVLVAGGGIETTVSDADGNITITSYDADGNKTETSWTNADGSSGYSLLNLDGSHTTHTDDGLSNIEDRVFDTGSRLLSRTWSYANGSSGTEIRTYDSNGEASISMVGGSGSDVLSGGTGNDSLDGGAGSDTLTDNAGTNLLQGGDGNDTLTANGGINTLQGGSGDDVYVIAAAGQLIEETGTDTADKVEIAYDLQGSAYQLADGVEQMSVTATQSAAVVLAGNAGANVIDASTVSGVAVTLEGGAGNDTLTGNYSGSTDATFIFDAAFGQDTVSGGNVVHFDFVRPQDLQLGADGNALVLTIGTDQVRIADYFSNNTSVYRIEFEAGGVVEALHHAEIDALLNPVTGNAIIGDGDGNVLNGTVEADVMYGRGGNDTLICGAGNDRLNGGFGLDTLIGGQGNDIYVVDSSSDVIVENVGEGTTDTVRSSVTFSLAAIANVEKLTLTGNGAIDGAGNDLDNLLAGNGADNTLIGGAGNDRLNGGLGSDKYLFGRGDGADTIVDNDITVGNSDFLLFDVDIAFDQLWFKHVGTNLEVSVIGTSDKVTVRNWYNDAGNSVETIRVADGHYLIDSQVEQLVQAMAGMTPPPGGQTSLTSVEHQQLDAVLTASWQSA